MRVAATIAIFDLLAQVLARRKARLVAQRHDWPQEGPPTFQSFRPDARDLPQLIDRIESAMGRAPFDDPLGQRRAGSRELDQLRPPRATESATGLNVTSPFLKRDRVIFLNFV